MTHQQTSGSGRVDRYTRAATWPTIGGTDHRSRDGATIARLRRKSPQRSAGGSLPAARCFPCAAAAERAAWAADIAAQSAPCWRSRQLTMRIAEALQVTPAGYTCNRPRARAREHARTLAASGPQARLPSGRDPSGSRSVWMAVPAHETCRGIYTSATDHVAVVLGPPRNAVGAATLGRDSTVQSENELPRGDTRPHGRAASQSSCCRWRSAAARSWGDALSTLETPRAGPSEAAEGRDP